VGELFVECSQHPVASRSSSIEDFARREIDQGIASVGDRTYQQLPRNAEEENP